MVSEKNNETPETIDRILRERLDQFNVPVKVRNEIRDTLLALFQRPNKKPFGACVMTPEASIASDQERKLKEKRRGGPTPEII